MAQLNDRYRELLEVLVGRNEIETYDLMCLARVVDPNCKFEFNISEFKELFLYIAFDDMSHVVTLINTME